MSLGESIGHEAEPAGHAAAAEERHRLSRLREMALLVAAEVVDRQLESYLRLHGIDQIWGVQERILVCVTPRSNAARMLESGRRNADRFHGELYAVYVKQPALAEPDREVLQQNLDYARELGAHVETLSGLNAAEAIMKFARGKGITQMFVGHSMRQGAWRRLWSNLIDRLIRSAEGIDVVVYPHYRRCRSRPPLRTPGTVESFFGLCGRCRQNLPHARRSTTVEAAGSRHRNVQKSNWCWNSMPRSSSNANRDTQKSSSENP